MRSARSSNGVTDTPSWLASDSARDLSPSTSSQVKCFAQSAGSISGTVPSSCRWTVPPYATGGIGTPLSRTYVAAVPLLRRPAYEWRWEGKVRSDRTEPLPPRVENIVKIRESSKRMRTALWTLVLVLAGASCLTSEAVGQTAALAGGERVRVRYESENAPGEDRLAVGSVGALSEIRLLLLSGRDSLSIPLSRVQAVDIQTGPVRRTGRDARRGALIGLGLGTLVYGIAVAGCGSCNSSSDAPLVLGVAAFSGGAIGALIGSSKEDYVWVPVPLGGSSGTR